MMRFECDENKNKLNIQERGLDFLDAQEMFQGPMLIGHDKRKDYRENRYVGLGYIKSRIMVVVFTKRAANIIRIISLRKANKREQTKFKKTLKD